MVYTVYNICVRVVPIRGFTFDSFLDSVGSPNRIESNRIESIFYQYRIDSLLEKKVIINPRKKVNFAFIYDSLISILID